VWFGFWFGALHAAGGLVGTVAGAYLAGHFYGYLAGPLHLLFGTDSGWVDLVSFFLIFVVANRVTGFVFYLIDRTFRFITQAPFLKTINRFVGAALGLAEGVLVTGLTLYFASRVALPVSIEIAIAESVVAAKLIVVAGILVPLLPDLIRKVQPYVPGVTLPIPE
jgi:uncharacterized membrane protein required for colicin V production